MDQYRVCVIIRSIAAGHDDLEDGERAFNLKETAIFTVGVASLTAPLVGKAELVVSTLAQRGLHLVPAGQFGFMVWGLAATLVAISIVAAVLQPRGVFGKAFPLAGAFLMACGIFAWTV
jgi:hypothetical protein